MTAEEHPAYTFHPEGLGFWIEPEGQERRFVEFTREEWDNYWKGVNLTMEELRLAEEAC